MLSGNTPIPRPIAQRIVYAFSRQVARVICAALFQIRVRGREHFPQQGPVLVCSNHQSYLDPILIGLCNERQMSYVARESLFRNRFFRFLIRQYNAFPIERDGKGMGGIRETIRRLRKGDCVVIHPEGTRTRDGKLGPILPGFCALARRTAVDIVPMAISGAYEVWPRNQRLPSVHPIRIVIGKPLLAAEVAKLDNQALVREVERRISAALAAGNAAMPSQP